MLFNIFLSLLGRQAYRELVEQRDIFKSTQRKLLDIANTMGKKTLINYQGLSTRVIRFIERQSRTDGYSKDSLTLVFLIGVIVIISLFIWLLFFRK